MKDFINNYFEQINTLLTDYLHNGYTVLAHWVEMPLALIITLALIFLGIRSLFSYDVKVMDLVRVTLLSYICYFLVLSWGDFTFYLVDLFQNGAQNIADVLLNANPFHTGDAVTLHQALEENWVIVGNIQTALFHYGGVVNLAPLAYGLLVAIIGYGFIGLVIVELTIAKVMMAILFIIAPIIFPMLFFKRTETIFNNWLGHLVGFSLLIIMVSCLVALIMSLFAWAVGPIVLHQQSLLPADYGNLEAHLPAFFLVAIVCFVAVFKVANLAMHIGGGINSGTGVGAAIAGTMAGTALGYKIGKSIANLFRKK